MLPGQCAEGEVATHGAPVAVTIDSYDFPHKVLYLRGRVAVDEVAGVAAEYAEAATKYFGQEQGRTWVEQLPAGMVMKRFALTPEWVAVLDFQTRFPSAIS